MVYDLIVVGGGAAGFFSAIIAAENNPKLKIGLLERTRQTLTKVKISGGGRCNVTHHLYDPKDLSRCYPRGNKELIAPFFKFNPSDMIKWLESKGVKLKVEEDRRMFPISDSSQTIIDCFTLAAKNAGVALLLESKIESISKQEVFHLKNEDGSTLQAKNVIFATGSSPKGHSYACAFGHTIVEPVPSLFTFKIPDFSLETLSGIAVPAIVKVDTFSYQGPLLITHWGFSGPAVLKLSAFAARVLHEKSYQAEVNIQWTVEKDPLHKLLEIKEKKH